MTETDELLYGVDAEGIARLTLNRPQARNALTFAMYERLHGLSLEIDADPAIRAVVIQGAGGRAFAAGTDRKAATALAEASVRRALQEAVTGRPPAPEPVPVPRPAHEAPPILIPAATA